MVHTYGTLHRVVSEKKESITMVELRPSNFRMIYIALKIDWILSLVLPLVLFGLLFALDHQLRRPGIASPNIGTEEISLSLSEANCFP